MYSPYLDSMHAARSKNETSRRYMVETVGVMLKIVNERIVNGTVFIYNAVNKVLKDFHKYLD